MDGRSRLPRERKPCALLSLMGPPPLTETPGEPGSGERASSNRASRPRPCLSPLSPLLVLVEFLLRLVSGRTRRPRRRHGRSSRRRPTSRPRSALVLPRPRLPQSAKAAQVPLAAPPDDCRTLAVRFDRTCKRHREFRAFIEQISQDDWEDWPIQGPRTTAWVLQFMLEHGGTPRGWHRRWMAEPRLSQVDKGVDVHELACIALEALCCYDQINAPNLASAEHLCRQLQLVEERYKDRRPGSFEGHDAEADFHLYAGSETRGILRVAPALSKWVAEQLQCEAAVAKERRKACEERALARPKKGPNDNKGE